jgi:O-antigen ligase
LAVFGFRFADYFESGAASASARVDYWEAAFKTARTNPIFGTGPGTFQIPYAKVKRPDSEMARLTHNDYLQQASDSGFAGMVLYTGLVFGSLLFLYRPARLRPEQFVVWLGLTGWALHSVVEFGLYIPAIAWPAFTMLGWLWATSGGRHSTGEGTGWLNMPDSIGQR